MTKPPLHQLLKQECCLAACVFLGAGSADGLLFAPSESRNRLGKTLGPKEVMEQDWKFSTQ